MAVILLCALPGLLALVGIDLSARGIDEAMIEALDADAYPEHLGVQRLMFGATLYTLLEWTVVCLSLATAALAVARARQHPDVVAAMIASVALWSAFISGLHLMAFQGFFFQVANPVAFLLYTWAIAQTFTGALFVIASLWAGMVRRRGLRSTRARRSLALVGVTLLFGVLACVSVWLTARATVLPLELSPEGVFSRPLDLPALILFALLLLVIFPVIDRVYRSVFSFALWLSAIALTASQMYAALASAALFDAGFMASLLTKAGGFTIIFLGLVWHYRQLCDQEIELRERMAGGELRVHMLINNAPEGIVTFGPEAIISGWNPRATELFGCSRQEALGRSLFECLEVAADLEPSEFSECLERLLAADADEEERCTRIYQVRSRDPDADPWIPVEFTLVGADADPQPIYALLARDISESQAMQQRLAQIDRLAAVGTLAAGVAHEINNPLAYIRSNVAFARESVEELPESLRSHILTDADNEHVELFELLDEMQSSLQAAESGCERVAHIVSDMLAIAHRSEEPLEEPVEPAEAIDAALRLTRAQLSPGTTLSTDLQPTPRVVADPSRLTQIVVNLVVNALHAVEELPEERRQITLRLFPRRDRVILEVEDRGPGVPDDLRERVFDPFFTTKPVGKGTGLGLSLSRSIAHELKGELRLCPSEQGARFQLALPAVRPSSRG
ncbi:hypothetical protein DL240_16885 [Lujinxingia litoralis]|uniref:histidine kinase n=2 Tax=Lujinxingia litoralis TaxID=2211119 RepID=A0A328C654_9DELT|nr:hypothetical protein DL240_16885 [Lujinxingia litoralis]